jgi:hypothetical protein
MYKKALIVGLMTAGVLAGAAVMPNFAEADYYGRPENYRRDNGSWYEARRDRQELWRDQAELERDREDLRRLYQRGASRAAIERKRAEIRNDLGEIRQSQEEVREGYSDLRRDRYGYDNRYDRGRGQSNDQGWWGWGNGWWNRNR